MFARPSRRIAFAVLAVLIPSIACAFTPTSTPVSPAGGRAIGDLPKSQHMRNTVGSDGSGLCVFTSAEMLARWQNILSLAGYQEWMRRRPGGGWPEKFDQTITAFCREKGVAVPRYVQHTAGDLAFLELAFRTGRCPAITYAGKDDNYREAINHMVFCAHLDNEKAAIIDNNRPGFWIWMTRAELKTRWLGSADRFGRLQSTGGGWAIVFLDPPPPPYAGPPSVSAHTHPDCGCGGGPDCPCGPDCACGPRAFGQCQGGRCPAPSRLSRSGPWILTPEPSAPDTAGPPPIGSPPSDRHHWAPFDDGVWGWRFKPEGAAAAPADYPTGVVPEMVNKAPAYSINGQASTKEEVYSLLQHGSLSDDSGRWHLAAVGDAAFLARVRADVAKLPAEAREKLHVQAYAPTAWQVDQFRLPAGVVLRKPAVDRVSADVGVIPTAEYSDDRLATLLGDPDGPTPRPPAKPGPNTPGPGPSPASPSIPWPWLAAAAAAFLIFRK